MSGGFAGKAGNTVISVPSLSSLFDPAATAANLNSVQVFTCLTDFCDVDTTMAFFQLGTVLPGALTGTVLDSAEVPLPAGMVIQLGGLGMIAVRQTA
ncbi:MAG: hypothetical protein AAF371_05565 [Pseudomonadota bacterium]